MTRNMVWLTALLAQFWLEHGSYEPGVAGSSPARSIIFFHVSREWSSGLKTLPLRGSSARSAGSNPASRKSFY